MNTKAYFDVIHADLGSQVIGTVCEISDTMEIADLRKSTSNGESWLALGDALCHQLRYREAIEAYTEAIQRMPDDIRGYRSRAGRYLSTLQAKEAKKDFLHCRTIGGDSIDIGYRIGLCCYFSGNYTEALLPLEEAYSLCDEEMGIAIIYWHTLCCFRSGSVPLLLHYWHGEMNVGHHTAYDNAVRVFCGVEDAVSMIKRLDNETEDLEYVISLYGICVWLRWCKRNTEADALIELLLRRNDFWPCYAYLAAWNDTNQHLT